ncbi:carboxymuconolactone decarboxylase family protein [Saccharopolyspora sp. WRP15-2]|uniref:Carboxymuconolactone decarboxylase family protein n=1 Tax=Saccharopolyspora oryzae TaxID=2997343 RepID=A0ABT4UY55_9PSEU|nr:carboxymuconolactone decarboxylase family protein [Saccharopolyspora oryzae]MDA3626131.1 carboxymuconolactone decarboxylase family protein [Saccharopolyspora oryzae]
MAERPSTVEEFRATYEDMLGFVPPRVASRFEQGEPEVLLAQERLRNLIMYPEALDQKTVQLVLFGILHAKLSDAAKLHGLAALRAGASWDELRAVIDLAFLFTGYSAANRGPQLLADIADLEKKSHG